MNVRAQIRMLPDGRRLHLQDGPIDVILQAFGNPLEIECAYRAVTARFKTILDELCSELTYLRQRAYLDSAPPCGLVARRMLSAVKPFCRQTFITPMAAVAGAVAEELLSAMTTAAELSRAYVNDGGDIAIHLADGEKFVLGMVDNPTRLFLFGTAVVDSATPIRGIATSGWRGRSFSLGIADSVTVLAGHASAADAAATVIANAVDLPKHPSIVRVPACKLAPDSDLGNRCVTQSVGKLTPPAIADALAAGTVVAESLRSAHLIRAAALTLQGETSVVGSSDILDFRSGSTTDRRMVHV